VFSQPSIYSYTHAHRTTPESLGFWLTLKQRVETVSGVGTGLVDGLAGACWPPSVARDYTGENDSNCQDRNGDSDTHNAQSRYGLARSHHPV
jgi:hypothetical protein